MIFFFPFLLFGKKDWPIYKHETFQLMTNKSGHCSIAQAFQIMNLIKENNIQTCIQIGVFPELSLLPIAKTLKYKKMGKVYAIDSWKKSEIIKGFKDDDPICLRLKKLDFKTLYKNTKNLINEHELTKYCEILRKTPENVIDTFQDNSIDLIYFNETRCKETIFKNVTLYFPKVRDGGYILLNNPNQDNTRQALVYLLERTDTITSF